MPCSSSEAAAVIALLREAGLSPRATIVELGCGWGGLALAISRSFPEAQVVAVELSRLPYFVARARARRSPRVRVVHGDFFRLDLSSADAAICYLMRAPMPRLAQKFDSELRPGGLVAAVTFWFRGRRPSVSRAGVALYRWPAT